MATLQRRRMKKPSGVVLVPVESDQSLLNQNLLKNCAHSNVRLSNDSTIYVIQTTSGHHKLHRLCSTVSPHPPSPRLSNKTRVSRQSASKISRNVLPATNVVSLKGRSKSRQASSVRKPKSRALIGNRREQLVPDSVMDYDPYRDLESPHLLDDFDVFNDYYVAPSRNDSLPWPQQRSEERIWSVSQPSASTSSNVNECNSTYAQQVFAPQQQQPANYFANESGPGFCETFVANLPELNDLVDSGNSTVAQSALVDSSALSQSVSNLSQSGSIDFDLVLTESTIDFAELDQYLNAPDDVVDSTLPESSFGSIIREDRYENLVAVQLDHAYGTPSTSTQLDSVDLDPSILNEFFTPQEPAVTQMGPCSGPEVAISPSYTETFTNLEPYLKNDPNQVSPEQYQLTYPDPCIRETSGTPESTCSDSRVSTADSYKGTSEYRMKRDKNNVASQKSRLKRQNKFKLLKEEEVELKRRNAELIAIVGDLERQVKDFKEIMMKAITA